MEGEEEESMYFRQKKKRKKVQKARWHKRTPLLKIIDLEKCFVGNID